MTHQHADGPPSDELFSEGFWDERYRSTPALWSGRPNLQLVEQAAELPPGDALDVGCGEGADAIWLAQQGWQVTGVDVSRVALDRAAEHAAAAGMAERISLQQVDIREWEPDAARYDLVSAQYLHLPEAWRDAAFSRLAAAVRSGGTLLIVGHHPSDLQTTIRRPNRPELFFTAEQLAGTLDPARWQIVVAAAPQREAVDQDGRPVTISDAVLRACRL